MNDDAIIKVGFEVDYSGLKTDLEEVKKEFSSVKSYDYKTALEAKEHWNSVKESIKDIILELDKADKTGRATESFIKDIGGSVDEVVQSFRSMRESMPNLFPNAQEQIRVAETVKQANIEALNAERQLQQEITDEQVRSSEEAKQALSEYISSIIPEYQELGNVQKEIASDNLNAEKELQQEVQQTTQEKIDGEQEVHKVRTTNETKAHTQGLINIRKKRSLIIGAIKEFYNNTVKYTKMWMSLLGSAFAKVGSGFKNLLGNIFNRTGNQASSLFSNLKGLLGIAGGIGLYKLGSEAIKTSNDFKTMGNTSAVVARQMSNAFYEAAGDSYNSLVKLSNGTTQVTATLKKFINTWTGQIALMKAQLTAIGSNIGNLLVKVFYPLLVVLNRILAVVNLLVGKLASLFGFNTANLKGILGDLGGQGKNNKGMEDYAKATDKAAKSTKKLKDETKKAKENLQGYDKLNNTTTDDLDALSDTLDDLSDLGGIGAEGLIDTDALFDNLMSDINLIPEWLRNWIDELINLIKIGDWSGVGSKIGQLINKGLFALNDFLTKFDFEKIKKFNSALLDFINGLTDTVNWKVLGTDIAKGLNLITKSIDDLYVQAVQKGTLDKIGKALYDTFKGFLNNFDPEQAGRAAVSALRSMLDIIYSALSRISEDDMNKIAEGIHGIISGAFDRLLGISDGETKSGAEKIGESIAKIINLALETVGELINENTAKSAADAIISILNSAISGLDEERMKKALSGMLQFIGTFFGKLAEEVNVDEFTNMLIDTINNSIENGDVEKAVAGFTKFINKIFDNLKKILFNLNWRGLFEAVWDGIQEGGGLTNYLEFVVLPALFASVAHLILKAVEWSLITAALQGGMSAAIAAVAKGGLYGAVAALTIAGLVQLDKYGKEHGEEIAKTWENIGDKIGEFIVGVVDGAITLGQGFMTVVNGFIEGLGVLWSSITNFFTNIYNSVTNTVTNLVNKAEELKTNIKAKIDEIIENIKTTFSNLVEDAINFGKDFVMGIVEGIGDGAKWVYDKVNELVDGIKERFSHGLDINSPSKVMRAMAICVPEGIALGIEDGESDVTSAMDNLVDSIKFSDFYSEALQETDVFVSDVTDKLAGIEAPTLDPLQYQSKILSSPAAATRALSQSYADTAGQRTDGVLSGIYNRMINAGQTSGRNVIVDVYLDKNNRLGQYVIDTMKGQVVMTGGV